MQKTQEWQRQGQQIISQRGQQEIPTSKQNQNGNFQPPSQPMVQQIQDDLTALHNKQNQTPLVFKCKITNSYLFSFNNSELCSFMIRFVIFAFFIIAVQIFVQMTAKINENIKITLICLCVTQVVTFLILFFLDPGTIFQDELEKINQQRLYCQTCRVYKRYKTKHCKFCFKCVKNYDHHCSFFAKCIGRRNYLLYCLFILSTASNGIGCFGSLAYTLFHNIFNKL